MSSGLKIFAFLLHLVVCVLVILAVSDNWSRVEVDVEDIDPVTLSPDTNTTIKVRWDINLWGFKGHGFDRIKTVGVKYSEIQANVFNGSTAHMYLDCLNIDSPWARRPCKDIGKNAQPQARRQFRLRFPGCDQFLIKYKEAGETVIFLALPVLVLLVIQMAALGLWLTKKGEGLENYYTSFIPSILSCAFLIAIVVLYVSMAPLGRSTARGDCESNIRRQYEFDKGLKFPLSEVKDELLLGFILTCVALAINVIAVIVTLVIKRVVIKGKSAVAVSSASAQKDDKVGGEVAGFVPAPTTSVRLSGSQAGQPSFFKDLAKTHRHILRFVAQGKSDVEVYDGEKNLFQHAHGIGLRYAMWRRSGVFVGMCATLFLALFLTIYLLAADISGVSDEEKKHNALKDEINGDIVDFDETIDVTIKFSSFLGDLSRPLISLMMQFKALLRTYVEFDRAALALKEVKVAGRVLQIVAVWISLPALYIAYRRAHHVRSSMTAIWFAWSLVFGLPYILAVLPYRLGLTATPLMHDIVNALEAMLASSVPTQGAVKQVEEFAVQNGILPFEVLSLNTQVIDALFITGEEVIELIRPLEPMLPGLPFAITVLSSVAPLAFSLAFSVLNGAALVKMLLPTTPFLGYVVTLLPILLTSLNFTLFSPLFQLTPHLIFTFAVLALILAPMWYVVLGSGIRTSYTFETAQQSVKKCKKAFLGSQVLGASLLAAWVLYQVPGSAAGLMNFLDARLILTLIFNFARGFFVSAITIADLLFWMVGAVEDMSRHMRNHPEAVDFMHNEQAAAHAVLGYKAGAESRQGAAETAGASSSVEAAGSTELPPLNKKQPSR